MNSFDADRTTAQRTIWKHEVNFIIGACSEKSSVQNQSISDWGAVSMIRFGQYDTCPLHFHKASAGSAIVPPR